jgi:hypothetical protein
VEITPPFKYTDDNAAWCLKRIALEIINWPVFHFKGDLLVGLVERR